MSDLYERARPLLLQALQEVEKHGDDCDAGRDAERLMVHLTSVIMAYLAENRLIGAVDADRADDFDHRMAWAVGGLIFNMAASMPRGRGDVTGAFEWWMHRIVSAGGRRVRGSMEGTADAIMQFDLGPDGEFRERPFDFRKHMGRQQ